MASTEISPYSLLMVLDINQGIGSMSIVCHKSLPSTPSFPLAMLLYSDARDLRRVPSPGVLKTVV